MDRRVVITGLGVITSLGEDIDAFWQNLVAGKSGISHIKSFDTTDFDCKIGGEVPTFQPADYLPPKEIRRTDRFTHFAVGCAKKAMADAGMDLEKLDRNRIGVIIGSGIGGMNTYEQQAEVLFTKGPQRVSPFMIPMLIVNMASGYVSMLYGLKGPNMSVVSACATANHAIGESMRAIQFGDAEVMIAGGSEAAITRVGYAGFSAMRAMSTRNDEPTKASRPFDVDRDGFVMGEGAGVLILEELEHARKRGARIYCELVGYGYTADAYHMSAPAPEGEGAARSMKRALEVAKLAPEDISYINAHGTSTPGGDVCEIQAIKTVFGDYAKKVAISSTKSMTGHLLGAAGAIEMAACAKAIQTDRIPPTINLDNQDPQCDLDCVPHVARDMKVNAVVNNSFGFGGHNATLAAKKFVG